MSRRAQGFTLAEVAITLMIVGVALVYILQGLNTSMITAGHTHNQKVARELALLTLAQIEAGLFWEEIDDRMYGNYAEEGYELWQWEVVLGDQTFSDEQYEEDGTLQYDFYRYREEQEAEEDDDDDEEADEPYEEVRIKVSFPKLGDSDNTLTLERYIPWDQVYGEDEDDRPLDEDEEDDE